MTTPAQNVQDLFERFKTLTGDTLAASNLVIAAMMTPETQQKTSFTPPQVAKRLGVSPDTIRQWIESGRLAAVNTGQKKRPRYRISETAIQDFDRQTVKCPEPVKRKQPAAIPFRKYA